MQKLQRHAQSFFGARMFTTRTTRFSGSSKSIRVLLIAMPITACALGTWQIYRWRKKMALIEDHTQKLRGQPLLSVIEAIQAMQSTGGIEALPMRLTGHFSHDQEMLVGPRQRDGRTGFLVITPFTDSTGRALLVNRGWIAKQFVDSKARLFESKDKETSIYGLLRKTTLSNLFTPKNDYVDKRFYFIDIEEMSQRTKTEPILLEVTIDPRYNTDDLEAEGIPVGKAHEVQLIDNHLQYIVTWYALALATAVMSFNVLKGKNGRKSF